MSMDKELIKMCDCEEVQENLEPKLGMDFYYFCLPRNH